MSRGVDSICSVKDEKKLFAKPHLDTLLWRTLLHNKESIKTKKANAFPTCNSGYWKK
jgi:hypothetical protein